MMKQLLRALIVCAAIFSPVIGAAQCPNDNTLTAGSLTPPGVAQTATATFNAGQYMLCQMVSGANYTVSTCAGSAFDTQITVYDDVTGALLAYNDDYCGLRSTVFFTATNCNNVRILLDRYSCNNSGQAHIVQCTQNTAGNGLPTLTDAQDVQVCYGQPANIGIAGNGTGGTPPYVFSWTPPANLTSTNTTNTTVTTVTTTAQYTLTMTDASGCADRDTVQVSVLPAPPVFLGNDTTLCGTALTLDAGNPGSSFLWSTGAGTQQLTVTQSGTYAVTVQFPNGCVNSDNITVTLNAPPNFTLGPDVSTCGSSVLVDAGSGFSTYTWSNGGTTQTQTVTSNDTLSVIVVDPNGCVMYDTISIELNPSPVVNLGPNITQCGGSATLNAGNPGALYFWSNNTSSQTTTVSTSGTYFVNVLTQAGCPGSDTIVVTINNQPVVNLGPDTSICLANVILDAGNPGSSYLWSNSQTTQTVTVSSGTYWVLVTDPTGCSDRDTIVVTTNQPSTVTASQDTSICPGGTATLSATGAVSYLWSNNSAANPTTVSPTINTAYYVVGTDANGCQAADVVVVTILPTATAQFTASVIGATANFTNQSVGAITYSWNFGDLSPVNNTASPSHTYTANGTYTVTLTVTSICGTDTYTQTVTITQVGIQDQDIANTLSIYPNPNSGEFTVSFTFTEAKDVNIQLTDVSGRVITSVDEYQVLNFTHEFGDSGLSNGVYFLTISTTEGIVTRKIAVQK